MAVLVLGNAQIGYSANRGIELGQIPAAGLAVEDRDGLPVLALSSEWDGERYVQYIYGYQGQLCELFTAAEYDFAPEDGEPVCAAQAFEPTLEGDLLTVRVTDETGHVSTVYIARRCAQ